MVESDHLKCRFFVNDALMDCHDRKTTAGAFFCHNKINYATPGCPGPSKFVYLGSLAVLFTISTQLKILN